MYHKCQGIDSRDLQEQTSLVSLTGGVQCLLAESKHKKMVEKAGVFHIIYEA